VRAGERSLEFCGGTHVSALGAIGQIQIIAEGSIGSNTRRIEAITGIESVRRSLSLASSLERAASALKAEPDSLVEAVERSQERLKAVERERDGLRQAAIESTAGDLLTEASYGVLVKAVTGLGADDLRQLAGSVRQRGELTAVVLGSVADGKVAIAVASDATVDARALVKEIGPLVSGGGGGSPTLAVAGGKNPAGLEQALDAARSSLGSR
jgi:alanyl-tRNA synthetase